jgi:glycosyltransferase involved in cell wall biosynthesis
VNRTNASAAAAVKATQATGARVSILVGGHLTAAERVATALGQRPRVDVFDLEQRLGAQVYDFTWLNDPAAHGPFARRLIGLAKRLVGWSAALSLTAYWRLRDDDLVYATGEDVGLPLAMLLRLLRRNRPRLLLRTEQPVFGRTPLRRSLFAAYVGLAIKRVDLTFCRTRAHVRYLISEHGVAAEKVRFVPETTDDRYFTPEQATVPVEHGIDEPFILSAGLEMRDYETLLAAVRDLPVRVVIAAGSPWSQLQYSSQQAALPANVQVASFPRFQMRELYRAANLVVLPIKQTDRACGMNVVLEAWAMERPVIATRTMGLVDYIEDGRTGSFVEVGDVGGLRSRIVQMLGQPEEAQRLGRNGHQRVTHN